MTKTEDELIKEIIKLVNSSKEPLETQDIQARLEQKFGNVSRNKVMYRLTNLRAEGEIRGKVLTAGKGVWVWWKVNAFDSKASKI